MKPKNKRKNKKYDSDFKLNVVLELLANNLTYSEIQKKYFPNKLSSKSLDFIKKWKIIYLEEGVMGLIKERRGRKTNSSKRGRPPKFEEKVGENIIEENRRLRAENDYLKKLAALVQSQEKLEQKRKQK